VLTIAVPMLDHARMSGRKPYVRPGEAADELRQRERQQESPRGHGRLISADRFAQRHWSLNLLGRRR